MGHLALFSQILCGVIDEQLMEGESLLKFYGEAYVPQGIRGRI